MSEVTLKVINTEVTRDIPLTPGRLTIGRSDEADLHLDDRGLSRLHASIHLDGERLWILDEGSVNGCFVNGHVIPAEGAALKHNDEISLGEETSIRVQISQKPLPAAAEKRDFTFTPGLQITIGLILAVVFLGGITALGVYLRSGRRQVARTSPPVVNDFGTPATTPQPLPSDTATKYDLAVSPTITPVDDPEAEQATQLYLRMSEAEKLEFLDRRARHITRMMGNREYAFDQESLGYIRNYVDNYARRVGNGSTRIWGEDLRYMFDRAQPLAPLIIRAFDQHGVPRVVGLYIPMIESEYRPCLESPVGAKGLFQFMGATAEGYGVPASERCNVERMAPAAAKYMRDRISEFGTDAMSVALGIAGYNRSPDSVRRDLQNVIDQKNNERSFWTLVSRREELDHWFQRENVKYVPKFFAAAIVGETPAAFGLEMKKLSTIE